MAVKRFLFANFHKENSQIIGDLVSSFEDVNYFCLLRKIWGRV